MTLNHRLFVLTACVAAVTVITGCSANAESPAVSETRNIFANAPELPAHGLTDQFTVLGSTEPITPSDDLSTTDGVAYDIVQRAGIQDARKPSQQMRDYGYLVAAPYGPKCLLLVTFQGSEPTIGASYEIVPRFDDTHKEVVTSLTPEEAKEVLAVEELQRYCGILSA